MELGPSSKANRYSAGQETPHILENPKVHYRVHKCPSPVPILSQLDPVHKHTSHFLKIHLNITLPFTPGSPKWSLSLRFPHKNPVYAYPLHHTRYVPRPSHSSRFYHPNNIGWGVQNNFLYRTRIPKFMKPGKRAVHKRCSLSHRKQRPKRHLKKQPLRTSSVTGIPASRNEPVAGSCRRSSGNETAKFRTTLSAHCQVAPTEPSSPLNFQNTSDDDFTDPTFYVQYIKRHFLCEYKRNIQDLDLRTRCIKKLWATSKWTSKIKNPQARTQ
jgi:hypothetical protein